MNPSPLFRSTIAWTCFTLCLGGLGIAAHAATSPDDPSVEWASLRVLEGYQVNLFASETLGVVKPIQIRFDARGRLWVAGSTVYPQIEPGQLANDKIVILEDRDGDGTADASSVFAEGLMIPTGLELGDGGLYVGQGNELLHLRDTDGDGKEDERRVVLRGFGTGDAHQTINSFTWSPGGALFMCQGLHAFSRVETPWGIETLTQAGVWRLFPRQLRLDPFLDQAMGPQNPFGVVFDQWGQPIVVAGNGEGIYFLTPGMTRSHDRVAMKSLWSTGRKFGGGDFVENTLWPQEAQGELITGSYLNNTVSRFRITEEGAGFKVEDLPALITSTDTSFRIVDARFGPDGALYLCDWYNPIIGHYQASFRHPDRDKTHGRIWRVTPKGRAALPRPELVLRSNRDLLEVLRSPERWNRQLAKRVLADRPASAVMSALTEWLSDSRTDTSDRTLELVEALGVCESQEQVNEDLLKRVLESPEPRARAYATGTVGRWVDRLRDPIALLKRSAGDEHPRVRLEAVIAASRLDRPEALEIALSVVNRPMDPFIEYALTQTVRVLKPYWRDPLLTGKLQLTDNSKQVEWLVKTDRTPDTLQFVVARLRADGLSAESREGLLGVIADAGGADELALLLDPDSCRVSGTVDSAMRGRTLGFLLLAERLRAMRPSGDLGLQVARLLQHSNVLVQAHALRLAGAWKVPAMREQVASIASQCQPDYPLQRAAVESLGLYRNPGSRAQLEKIAAECPTVALSAIEALTSIDLNSGAAAAARYLSVATSTAESSLVFGTLLARQGGAAALEIAFAEKTIPREIAEAGLQLMGASGRRQEGLARLLSRAAGVRALAHPFSPKEVTSLAEEVRSSGVAARGERLYQRPDLNCTACHAIRGSGGSVGPDLGALGTSQTVEFIIGAILEPQKEVKEGFTAIQISMKDGEEYQGYLVRETADTVAIRDTLLQREVVVRRSSIQERRKLGSVMPSGLVDGLSREEFRDLVSFLSALGRQK